MERSLIKNLLIWKEMSHRKPLLLDGARQVGKSYLIEILFGHDHFKAVHKFDFNEDKELDRIFRDSLDPNILLQSLELRIGKKINLKTDLVFFDEIGESQRAVDSLKYFSEKMPEIFLCASGSNIGLLKSFPVGKTHNLELFPMSFHEFLMASGDNMLIQAFESQSRLQAAHQKLWPILLNYFYVGGMPEAVSAWYTASSLSDKIMSTSHIHRNLIDGYDRDFGKCSGKTNALHIASVFSSVPRKLQQTLDDSVKRYSFKEVITGKKQYNELRGPIDWLEKSKLVSKNYIIRSKPRVPRKGKIEDNFFKLFFFDMGLLCHSLGLSYQDIIEQGFAEKGYIAENFVQNELRLIGKYPTYSWKEGKSEIEFILKTKEGDLFPLEVKSGRRTKAKSLGVYREKYHPVKTLKLIGSVGGTDSAALVWPLYYAEFIKFI